MTWKTSFLQRLCIPCTGIYIYTSITLNACLDTHKSSEVDGLAGYKGRRRGVSDNQLLETTRTEKNGVIAKRKTVTIPTRGFSQFLLSNDPKGLMLKHSSLSAETKKTSTKHIAQPHTRFQGSPRLCKHGRLTLASFGAGMRR